MKQRKAQYGSPLDTYSKPISVEKTCTKCEKTKPISEFGKKKEIPDGYDNRCSECYREIQREYRKQRKSDCIF